MTDSGCQGPAVSTRLLPVMNDDSDEARNSAPEAVSSRCRLNPMGVADSMVAGVRVSRPRGRWDAHDHTSRCAAGWVALRLGTTQSPRQAYVVGDAIVRLSPRNSATTS
jgi:hypothetical protein